MHKPNASVLPRILILILRVLLPVSLFLAVLIHSTAAFTSQPYRHRHRNKHALITAMASQFYFRDGEHSGEAPLNEIQAGFEEEELSPNCEVFDKQEGKWIQIEVFLNNNREKQAEEEDAKPKCVPCSSMDPSAVLSKEHVNQRLQESSPALVLWKQEIHPTTQIPMLTYKFTAKNFQAAMDALNAMAQIAERENHHPDFHLTNYRDVQIDIYTHKVKGITENDITLAKMIAQEVKVNYSPKWLKEHPEAELSST